MSTVCDSHQAEIGRSLSEISGGEEKVDYFGVPVVLPRGSPSTSSCRCEGVFLSPCSFKESLALFPLRLICSGGFAPSPIPRWRRAGSRRQQRAAGPARPGCSGHTGPGGRAALGNRSACATQRHGSRNGGRVALFPLGYALLAYGRMNRKWGESRCFLRISDFCRGGNSLGLSCTEMVPKVQLPISCLSQRYQVGRERSYAMNRKEICSRVTGCCGTR